MSVVGGCVFACVLTDRDGDKECMLVCVGCFIFLSFSWVPSMNMEYDNYSVNTLVFYTFQYSVPNDAKAHTKHHYQNSYHVFISVLSKQTGETVKKVRRK